MAQVKNFKERSYKYFANKYIYYLSWYLSMNGVQRVSSIGIWVLQRIHIFRDILHEADMALGIMHIPGSKVGNYATPENNL